MQGTADPDLIPDFRYRFVTWQVLRDRPLSAYDEVMNATTIDLGYVLGDTASASDPMGLRPDTIERGRVMTVSIERRDGKALTRAERTSIEFYARHSGYDLAGYPVSVGNVERIDVYPVLLRNQSPSAVSQAIAVHLRKMLNGLTTPIYRITVG